MIGSFASSRKRLGFFGGTFDPPHLGHLELANLAIKQARLDKLLICPAYHAPLRTEPPLFSALDRLAMIQKICQAYEKMEPWDYEIQLQKTCFTYDTVIDLEKHFPDHKIFLLVGADQFSRLHLWQKHDALIEKVHFLVFARDTSKIKQPEVGNVEATFMENALINISSTDIRDKLCNQLFPDQLLPKEVSSFIKQKNLLSLN